jgi:hypothetical protein
MDNQTTSKKCGEVFLKNMDRINNKFYNKHTIFRHYVTFWKYHPDIVSHSTQADEIRAEFKRCLKENYI